MKENMSLNVFDMIYRNTVVTVDLQYTAFIIIKTTET